MKYYIDLNMKNNEILVGKVASSDKPFYVVFEQRYQADNFLRKINAGLIKNPNLDGNQYQFIREEVESLGTVFYYKYTGAL
jgi:hypothetical protein